MNPQRSHPNNLLLVHPIDHKRQLFNDSPKQPGPSEPTPVEVTVTPEEMNKYISVNVTCFTQIQVDEERVLLHHFISKLFGIFPRYSYGKMDYRSVQIFAASYVKRFFITRSVLQYNPKTICAAAFLLAIKVCVRSFLVYSRQTTILPQMQIHWGISLVNQLVTSLVQNKS